MPLKILVCSANFSPEATGVGKYSGEMVQWLVSAGHEVRVVAAPPYYPAWRIDAAYRGRGWHRETVHGAEVWRVPLWVPRRAGGLQRVLHLLSFGLAAAPVLLWCALRWRPQLCLAVAPFLTAAPAVWAAARLARAPAWLHVQDFEVDVAFSLRLLKNRQVQRAVASCERLLLRRFDRVSSISPPMLERAAAKGVAAERLVLFPNWADVDAVRPLADASPFRTELGLGPGDLVVQFSGTLSAKQGLHLLPEAARRLADLDRLHFVISGEGPLKDEIVRACAGLPRVHFLPLQPASRLGDLLGLADIHVLPQDAAAEDLVLPSKLSGMLASGRPVVATCAPGTEIARLLEGCGRIVPPGDAPALAAALRELAADEAARRMLGAAARRRAEQQLARERVLGRFAADLEQALHAA
jgi:colanic acid biosynthesis glycosyl transferase WcaI